MQFVMRASLFLCAMVQLVCSQNAGGLPPDINFDDDEFGFEDVSVIALQRSATIVKAKDIEPAKSEPRKSAPVANVQGASLLGLQRSTRLTKTVVPTEANTEAVYPDAFGMALLEEDEALGLHSVSVLGLQRSAKLIRGGSSTATEKVTATPKATALLGVKSSSVIGLQRSIKLTKTNATLTEDAEEQLDEDLKKHESDREAAKAAMQEATALREKEAKSYAVEKADSDANIASINSAVTSLEKGVAGGFIQTKPGQALRNLLLQSSEVVTDDKRQALMAFLQGSQGTGYVPASGEIIGILKELGGDMETGLADATSTENDSITNYEALMAAKGKEVASLSAAIEDKSVRTGEVAVAIAHAKNELSDTQAALMEDKKFLANMKDNCGNKEAEWAEISKTRAEETVAIAETIKILQDDDALELFKKTLPSASSSFVQVRARADKLSSHALSIIRAARIKASGPARQQLDFIALALHGKKMGFEKVIKMIDDMMVMLKTEQTDDDGKKTYCGTELDSADDSKKALEQSVADSETAMADAEESIATLTSEIKALEEGIAALDKSVATATEQRQKEHEECESLIADNSKAKELIGFAKNRLNKFYNPKLYVAPPKRDLEEAAPAFVQISAHRDAPPPPPQTFSAYSKKGEETNGVIAMLDMLVKDLDKEMQEGEVDEKDAQAEYEQMAGDAAEKRAADSASAMSKTSAKADTEVALQNHKDAHASSSKELMGKLEYIKSLHGECDWLMQYYDVRKEARASEADALTNAKAVLSGADFSMLLQVSKPVAGNFLQKA